MNITQAKVLQDNFKSGLMIAGKDTEGDLLWMGTDKQWENATEEEKANELKEIEMQKELDELNQYNNSLKN